ncbi:hypothetical protein DL96DRAFT_1805276 [Flagelloscypha sp. PMI_526]|nr:hypothetical protein DL96DRAFT_1805276 [Flagelloscypha sp. PMI_526]
MSTLSLDLYDRFLCLAADTTTLKACSLVSQDFRLIAQSLLFEHVELNYDWEEDTPPEISNFLASPDHAHICLHVRHLALFHPMDTLKPDLLEHQSKQIAEKILPQLTSIRSLRLNGGLLDDILRESLILHIFPRITMLTLGVVEKLPYPFALLGMCPRLRHLEVVAGSLPDKFMDLSLDENEREEIIEPEKLPPLNTLKVVYSSWSILAGMNWDTLGKLVKAMKNPLNYLMLDPQFQFTLAGNKPVFEDSNGLQECCSDITHLHIGTEGYNNTRKEFRQVPLDDITLSRFPHLTTLQFHVSGTKQRYCTNAISSFENSSRFFTWLASQLSSLLKESSKSSPTLSFIIFDIFLNSYNEPSPTCGDDEKWDDLDQVLVLLPSLESFLVKVGRVEPEDEEVEGTYKLNEYEEMVRRLLPLSAARGLVNVETMKNPLAVVNSANRV